MREVLDLFKIRREERIPALVALLVSMALNAICIYAYFGKFSKIYGNYKWLFVKNFHLSGYDPLTYNVVTDWEMRYNVYRHPLLAYFMYVPSMINQCLMEVTGLNLVQFVVAAILVISTVYSFIFLERIHREVVGLERKESLVMSSLNFSFAYVITASISPDHFIISMSALTLLLYICGRKMKYGHRLGKLQTILLFLLTAGISLNNGIKVFLGALFVNGRRFFKPVYLLSAVVIPAVMLWYFARWEYAYYVYPEWIAHKEMKVKFQKTMDENVYKAFRDTTTMTDSAQIEAGVRKILDKRKEERKHKKEQSAASRHTGKPIKRGEFWDWTDITTSRTETAVHNLFGESLLLHKDYLLLDVLLKRPVIVKYSFWLNYVVEGAVVLLFLLGIWFGRRSRFLWLSMSFFAFDMLLHMVIGFGINEIYIMSPHWSFVIPIVIAYVLRRASGTARSVLSVLLACLAAYMFIYNVSLLAGYLL